MAQALDPWMALMGFAYVCWFFVFLQNILTPLFTTPRGLRFASRGISPVMRAQRCYYSVLGTLCSYDAAAVVPRGVENR